MSRTAFLSFLLVFSGALNAYAQKFYIRAGGGYAYSHASQADFAHGVPISGQSAQAVYGHAASIEKASFTEGVNAAISIGYKIHPNIAVDLGAGGVLVPKKFKSLMADSSIIPPVYFVDKFKISSTTSLFIMPSVVLMTNNKSINLYSRLGLALPVAGKIIIEATTEDFLSWDYHYSKYELTSRFAVGFQGALGVKYAVNKKIALFLEASGLSMNRYAKELNRTEYRLNGEDKLASLNTSEKVTQYDFEYKYTLRYVPYSPSRERTFSIPYSNFGFNLGLIFTP